MRKAFELKNAIPRSFVIGGLTAKWGIGENGPGRHYNAIQEPCYLRGRATE